MAETAFRFVACNDIQVLRLQSADGTNRLKRECIGSLLQAMHELKEKSHPLLITGNDKFFSAGADLGEIAALSAPDAYEFSRLGQELMLAIERFPAPVCAAISGYCMGGGLDLVLACHRRIASPGSVFGHRGAALGLLTGWGGTQRLPRLVGKARALQMFLTAEIVSAPEALRIGLVNHVADDPEAEALRWLESATQTAPRVAPGRTPVIP